MSENVFKFGTNKIISFSLLTFYLFGMWPKKDSTILYSIVGYTFQVCTTLAWTIAKCIGTYMLEDRSEIIEFTASSIYALTSAFRGFTTMKYSKALCSSLNAISDFSLDKEESEIVQKKVKSFTKMSSAYMAFISLAYISAFINPSIIYERKMPVPIWLPYMNWKENDRDFCIGLVFSVAGIVPMSVFCAFTPIIAWYLLFSSSLKLDVLGRRLQSLGYENYHYKKEKWIKDLVKCIKLHQEIIVNIKKIEDSLSNVFFLQIASSAACICSVAYLLASQPLFGNINKLGMYIALGGVYGFEIFVLIYYGNEVALSSNRLSYSIYESNWTSLSVKSQKMFIGTVENWKKPYEIVVGKVFPMRIKIMTQILNVAYSIFNVLRKNNL